MSNNKPKKEITETTKKDYVTNKLLLVFTFAFAMLLFFMNIGRMMKNIATYLLAWDITKVVAIVGAVAFVVGIVMFIVERTKKVNTKYRLFSGKNIAVVSAVLAISAAALSFISFSAEVLTLIYIFIPALVVLYIVYYSYQREFFMIALSSILSGVAIWLVMSDLVVSGDIIILAVAELVLLLLVVFTIIANTRKGKLNLFGKEISVLSQDAKSALVYIAYALSIVLLAASFFFPAFFALYFIFALIGYILLTGIYFTVKLI